MSLCFFQFITFSWVLKILIQPIEVLKLYNPTTLLEVPTEVLGKVVQRRLVCEGESWVRKLEISKLDVGRVWAEGMHIIH